MPLFAMMLPPQAADADDDADIFIYLPLLLLFHYCYAYIFIIDELYFAFIAASLFTIYLLPFASFLMLPFPPAAMMPRRRFFRRT